MRIKTEINIKSVTRGLRVGELLFFVAIFGYLLIGTSQAHAAFNENINYQGKLTDGSAIPVSDAAYDVVFRLYTAAAGGSTVWTESLTNVALWTETSSTTVTRDAAGCGGSGFTSIVYATGTNESSIAVGQTIWNTTLKESAVVTGITTGTNTLCVSNPYSSWANTDDLTNRVYAKSGLFSVMLGTVSSLSSVDFNQTLYLGVTVGSDSEMSPRKMIGAVPAAFTAKTLNNNGSATIATVAGSTLSIGNTTGAVTMNSGGTSAWTNTSGGLTIATATSGTLALNSAGALNLSSAAASTVALANVANALNFDSDTLTIDALNNRIGIGNNAPSAKLDITDSLTDSNGTSSFYHNPTFTQTVNSYTNYGYKMVVNNTLSWGGDATYGIHVTNSSGSAGSRNGIYAYAVSSAIYGQGGTYGVYGDNSAYGTGVGVYGKTTGSTGGNALKAESTTITSSNLSVFNQTTSAFSGNGLLMNFANGSGSFTGNFLDLQKNSVSQFKIDSNGAVTGGTYNGLTVSSTTGTLSLANGSTLATSGGNSVTLTSTGTTNATLPSGTVTLMANPMSAAGDIIYGGTSGAPTRLAGSGTNGWVLAYNTSTNAPYWTAMTGGGGTLQNAYDYTSGNTILTTTGRNIAFTLGEVATPTSFTLENQDTAATDAEKINNSIASGTLANGLTIENTGAGTMTNAINILETAGAITTGINIGNNVGTGISIGTGVTTGISVGSGGITIAAGALAVNSDSITSDGATLTINAAGTVDVQDILNADSVTSDAGVSIAAGSSYTGAGAVTLSSGAASGLTIDSGTTGTLAIGTDSSAEVINFGTGSADKDITIGSTTSGSTIKIQSGSESGITIEANGTSTGNVQIGDGGTSSATPDLLVLDTGSAEPTGAAGAMYYSTALNKFRCYQNTGWTDCIGSGSGGSPAGSNTQIQFNNSGSFGANAGLTFDSSTQTLGLNGTDAEINMQGITNEPSSPSSGTLNLYAKSIGGRMMPKWQGPSGLDTPIQPFMGTNKVGLWNPPGNAATVPGVFGFTAFTASGTATARNVATTNLFTRTRRLGYVYSTAGTNVVGGARVAVAQYTVGDGSGLGGFYLASTFGQSDTITTARMFVGMTSATGAPTTVEPSTLTNAIGVGCGAADTSLKIFYGGSAAQTPISLGANFPCNTASGSQDLYELVLFAPTNVNNAVNYRVRRLGTTYEASGTLTAATPGTQLPSSTTLLAWRGWRATSGTSGSPAIDLVNIYIETDY